MAERVGKEQTKRVKGYLYYLGKDGFLWKVPTKVNKSGKKGRVGTEKIKRQAGHMLLPRQEGVRLARQDEERITWSRTLDQARSLPPREGGTLPRISRARASRPAACGGPTSEASGRDPRAEPTIR